MSEQETQFETEPDAASHANKLETQEVRTNLALQMLKQVRDSIGNVIQLLEVGETASAHKHIADLMNSKKQFEETLEKATGAKVVEGVFNGSVAVGSDGVMYDVPANYASKSRLVEGDTLKLTIGPDGSYTYKQIGPIERRRLVGKLSVDESSQDHIVVCDDKMYKVLAASVTYFKGVVGDEVVILVPREGESIWAAVENIVTS